MMKILCMLAASAALFACHSSPDRLDRLSQAATFPVDADWIPLRQAGATIGDVLTDGNNNGRELVGDASFAAVSVYSDGTDFFVRLRLDDDPTGSGQAVVAPFGWGILLDTNNDLNDYEFIVIIDGTGTDEIVLAQNTNQQNVGDPNDVAENDIFVTPADNGVDGNVSISVADSSFNGTSDFFLDFALPMSALNGVGLDLNDTLRFIAGTSNNGRSLSVDLMSCDDGATSCTLSDASSDVVFLDGSAADVDGDGVPSPIDVDDDNDGILDSDENALGVDPDADANGNGIPNWRDAGDEGDGSSTCVDADTSGLCDAPGPRFDSDGDAVPNHLDVDSDNDGIADLVEAGHGAIDVAGDGLVDGAVGANGFVDSLESAVDSGLATYVLLDTDGDGSQDRLDLDSDADGALDLDEVGGTSLDLDDDGRVDSVVDSDRDGLMASADGDEAAFGVPSIVVASFDTDGDGIPAPYDVADAGPGFGDSDGDGDDDSSECGGAWPACTDSDLDGQPDYMRSGLCGNGVLDAGEGCDDGNTTGGDGCSALCSAENGSACNASAPGRVGDASCASGNCDLIGNAAPGVCEALELCGNGLLEAGEGCDDGNTAGTDGCSGSCLIEAGGACNQSAPGLLGDGSCAEGSCNLDGGLPGLCEDTSDTDGDGVLNLADLDDDNDGILDVDEGDGAVDTDGDGVPDSRDLDSDDDGITDLVEGASLCADSNGDARCDGTDADGDGVADDVTGSPPPDTDGDGVDDLVDLDSDNDGADDVLEGGSGCADASPANAVCDGPDSDGDGLVDDALDGPLDSDGDGVADSLDLDSDNDGLSDLSEFGSGCDDGNGDEVCDSQDSDGDGIVDSIDDTVGHGDEPPTLPVDQDGDGDPDALDLDSDGDGTNDAADSGCTDTSPVDGVCDASDSDGDGIVDDVDGGDGFGSGEDGDDTDTDGDGVPDVDDLDDDNDGLLDADEGNGVVDADGDRIPDSVDLDSDNDGILDEREAGHDAFTGNGTVRCNTGVGLNGFCDALETSPDSGVADYAGDGPADEVSDLDGDRIPDFRDLDSDNDTITDNIENGGGCADVRAPISACDGDDTDDDGIVDDVDQSVGFGAGNISEPFDSDDDGVADFRDLDSDDDTIDDIVEATRGKLDADDDGAADGEDYDRDGMVDEVDDSNIFGGGPPALDTDGDGRPDYRDTDADGDGVSDEDEAGDNPKEPADSDEDGRPDFQDADSDGDGIADGVDNCRIDDNADQQDLDNNGRGSVCEVDYEVGIQGGGCASAGSSSTRGLGWLLLALGLLLVRIRRRLVAPALVLLVGFAGVGRAQAQNLDIESDYPVERLRLSSDPEGVLDVEWAAVTGHKVVDLGLWLGWADDPLNLHRRGEDGNRERAGSLVSGRMAGNLIGSIGLFESFQLGVEIPLILYQGQELGDFMDLSTEPTSFGMGDLRLVPKVALVPQDQAGVHIGVSLGFTLPTSSSDDYFGDSGATFVPEILVSRSFDSGLRLAANMGMVSRKETRVVDLIVDDELTARLGAGFRFSELGGPPLELDLTYAVATGLNDVGQAFNRNYSEVKVGGAYDIKGPWTLFAASGLGIAEGFGTPDWRLLAGLRFRRPVASPDLPVALGGSEERHWDSDHDGIYDAEDECPTFPENPNDYQSDDGCPDEVPDSDADGLDDLVDGCPQEPEDVDRFEDGDGCPDPDNDGDGFPDSSDACPDRPGVDIAQGCPDPDRDGDTVVDRVDNCPDEAGTVEFRGCNEKQLLRLTGSNLEILDAVYFRSNSDIILRRSFALLDNIAAVLQAHQSLEKIRIEGHTDSQGNGAHNKSLSRRRAEAVAAYLVRQGMSAERLHAVGFGEEQPIGDNATREGRAANRRVEFKIVGESDAEIDVERTGPTEDTIER